MNVGVSVNNADLNPFASNSILMQIQRRLTNLFFSGKMPSFSSVFVSTPLFCTANKIFSAGIKFASQIGREGRTRNEVLKVFNQSSESASVCQPTRICSKLNIGMGIQNIRFLFAMARFFA